jgi:hypothetical protein
MTAPKPTLDQLVREAKADRGPPVDWARVDDALFPRIERELAARSKLAERDRSRRPWIAAAVALAAAAALPLVLSRGPARPLDAEHATVTPVPEGTLSAKDRSAVVHVTRGATPARDLAVGDAIAAGDALDTRSGRATFVRPDPGGVAWALEDGSQVSVRASGATLILALAKGAVEAQVTPVAAGEAFAVDVDATRVAVHGTHFRVERQGTRAIVDLREGVVSIGIPPKTGATYGDVITAPAHVELDVTDPHGTLKVTHEANRVRAGVTLAVNPATPAVVSPTVAPNVPVPVLPSAPARPSAVAAPPAPPSAPAPPPATLPAVDPNAQRTLVEKVRACARSHVEGSDGVTITVSTRMELVVGQDGMVKKSTFDPPLAPDVQACLGNTLRVTRFAQPGAVNVSIDVTP